MKKAGSKNFGKPDEAREVPDGKVELLNVGEGVVGRAVLNPGWCWSTSVQPIAKTKSCEAPHFQFLCCRPVTTPGSWVTSL